MPDADLFLELAGIAGVFVGFGALIAMRSGATLAVDEIAQMRVMVGMGVWAVIAALAPVTLGRYDLSGHQLWAVSSVVALITGLLIFASLARTPEYRANWRAQATLPRPRWLRVGEGIAYGLYMLVLVLAPIVVLLGVAPDLEAALYFTVVVLILLGAAWVLLSLVLSQRRPASA
jgi:hypothetical protein